MACAQLGNVYANYLGNLTASRAWFTRARRLVDDQPPCLEQGWVAIAAMGCDVDDPAELLTAAELALDRARRFGDLNLETKALADAGLAHVQAGRVADGMALLDEAMALACGPADDHDNSAKAVCSFFTACYFAFDFERAASWSTLLRQQGIIAPTPGSQLFVASHCNSVEATLLIELGRWSEAEAILLRARADFERGMHGPSWHPDIALADLRIRQHRFDDAEMLLLGKDHSMQALLPAARLHLERGDHALARAIARRGLGAMGNDRLRAVELLTVLVDAEIAGGDIDAAIVSGGELMSRTQDIEVPSLRARAGAAQARALAASGAIADAVTTHEHAVDCVDARSLPLLRASLLIDLAVARERAGDRVAAAVDAAAAAAIVTELDVVLAPAAEAALARLARNAPARVEPVTATLALQGKWWVASCAGTSVRLQNTKGLRYLAALVARPGVERHVLDLVDSVEGVSADGPDRRALGDAGTVLDARARGEYRRRIEALRAAADDALEAGLLDEAETAQAELDQHRGIKTDNPLYPRVIIISALALFYEQ
jgi:tetratricopeptide (TPR) repeat protein